MLIQAVVGALTSYVRIALIIIPVLIVIEVMRDLNLIPLFARLLKPLTRHFRIADEGTLLLAIGMVFGLTYGAGAIIQSAQDGHLDRTSLMVVGIFLATCHALIEDSVLFSAMGGRVAVIIGVRFVTASVLSYLVARKIGRSKKIA